MVYKIIIRKIIITQNKAITGINVTGINIHQFIDLKADKNAGVVEKAWKRCGEVVEQNDRKFQHHFS